MNTLPEIFFLRWPLMVPTGLTHTPAASPAQKSGPTNPAAPPAEHAEAAKCFAQAAHAHSHSNILRGMAHRQYHGGVAVLQSTRNDYVTTKTTAGVTCIRATP